MVTMGPITNAPGTLVDGAIIAEGSGNSTGGATIGNAWRSWPSGSSGIATTINDPISHLGAATVAWQYDPSETIEFQYTAHQDPFDPSRLSNTQGRPGFIISEETFLEFDVIPEPSSSLLVLLAGAASLRRRRS